jgi:hypothetical protein
MKAKNYKIIANAVERGVNAGWDLAVTNGLGMISANKIKQLIHDCIMTQIAQDYDFSESNYQEFPDRSKKVNMKGKKKTPVMIDFDDIGDLIMGKTTDKKLHDKVYGPGDNNYNRGGFDFSDVKKTIEQIMIDRAPGSKKNAPSIYTASIH